MTVPGAMFGAMKPHLQRACEAVAAALPHGDEDVMRSWRVVYKALRRGDRVTQRTLPRIAGLAQHAEAIKGAIDVLIPALPRHLFNTAADLRTHAVAIMAALETGAER